MVADKNFSKCFLSSPGTGEIPASLISNLTARLQACLRFTRNNDCGHVSHIHLSRTTCCPPISFRLARHAKLHPIRTRGMDSNTHRRAEEQRRQAEIRQQIALLQAQLTEPSDFLTTPQPPRSPKRKAHEPTTLAPATPSPSKFVTNNPEPCCLTHLFQRRRGGLQMMAQVLLSPPRANQRHLGRRIIRQGPLLSHEGS